MPTAPHRILVAHAPPSAFAPRTRAMLDRLGYAVLDPEDFPGRAGDREDPDLLVVDERCLGELPPEAGSTAPIVVLSGRRGVTGADPRIAGAVPRPAGLHELYRLVQDLLEEHPRSSPRVPTHLPVRCSRQGRRWRGALLSISENGGLLRSPEPLLLGSLLRLRFELPRCGPLELEAEVAYQLLPDVGVVFNATPPPVRQALARYLAEALGGVPG